VSELNEAGNPVHEFVTAPYFRDDSARTLEDVVAHYNKFFEVASDLDGPGPQPPLIVLTPGDQSDIVAYLKLLK
jgi:cytochrome c peroxidase